MAASAHMLFMELALIRWVGANVLHLSYFSNFVLLGAFLGIGLGFLLARRTESPPWYGPVVLGTLVAFVVVFPVRIDRSGSDVVYFTSLEPSGLPMWVTLPIIFLAVAAVMASSGQIVARYFARFPALRAYRLDLVGALLGIAAFTASSFVGIGPVGWAVVIVAGYALLLSDTSGRPPLAVAVALVTVAAIMGSQSFVAGTTWSSYYRVDVAEQANGARISVNGIPHQVMVATEDRVAAEPMYLAPYERGGLHSIDRALIIGAGSGSDVAIALREGAMHVDAVEIDRAILRLGSERHPDAPYASPRVTAHIDDGRAYLQRAAGEYDLILFALPDSLTLVSGAGSLRLESYLFTEEAVGRARALLSDDGVFAMYNYYREPWLVGRLASTLTTVFGHEPCLDEYGEELHAAALVTSLDPGQQRCEGATALPGGPPPVTDDRPFLYLRDGDVPSLYVGTLALVLAISLIAVRLVCGPFRRMRGYADLFLLGVGFLLLETKSVTTFALLFGTTWLVNAVVFGGVLLSVLLAVEVTRLVTTPRMSILYAALLASLALAWVVPDAWLLALPVVPRVLVSVAVAFLPIFMANIIFARRLETVPEPLTAFGVNLLGAMVGGALEYAAIAVGFRGLLIVAAMFYVAAVVALRTRTTSLRS